MSKAITLKIDVDVEDRDIEKIIKLVNKYNRTLIDFSLDFCEIEDVIKYYINRHLQIDLEELGVFFEIYSIDKCINLEFVTDTIDSKIELEYMKSEFKRHFGVNILNCDIRQILRIIFIDCCSYQLREDHVIISFDTDDLHDNWLFKYFKNNR